jgi:hypothetical protein
VCVNANPPFGAHHLPPLVTGFPKETLDIVLDDQVIDRLEQRADVTTQAAPMPSRVRVFIDYPVKALRLG